MLKTFFFLLFSLGVSMVSNAQQKPAQNHKRQAVGTNQPSQASVAADQTFIDKAAKGGLYGLMLA